ncbi:MAG: hypothetical protein RLZZ490_740 [Cyanobacteriota bacterium]
MYKKFANGNYYSYQVGLQKAGYTTRFNLLQWSVNGMVKEKRLIQGVHTTKEMESAKAEAYQEASS